MLEAFAKLLQQKIQPESIGVAHGDIVIDVAGGRPNMGQVPIDTHILAATAWAREKEDAWALAQRMHIAVYKQPATHIGNTRMALGACVSPS